MNKYFFRFVCLILVSTSFILSCQASRNVPSAETSGASNTGVANYPGSEFYGNRWNTQYIRLNSDPKPSGTVEFNLVPEGTSGFVMPVCRRVISEFGMRNGRMHTGTDVILSHEQAVYSAFDGMVRIAKDYGTYGKVVLVRHDNGLETLYSHLNSISVKINQRVKAGDRLGGVGQTGNAVSDHLHFEIRFMGEPINPRLIVDFENCELIADKVVISF